MEHRDRDRGRRREILKQAKRWNTETEIGGMDEISSNRLIDMEHRDKDKVRIKQIFKQAKTYGTQRQRYRKRKSDHQTG